MDSCNLLELKNITKSYSKGNIIIDDISLSIAKEEILFLLGPSGCGKSTLLRVISGLLPEDSGDILVEEKSICKKVAEKRNMAMVFQNYALWPHLNVFDNVAFGLKIAKKSKQEIKLIVDKLLDIVELKEYKERLVTSLSGGQQQRVALARALAVQPKLLLLDEPLSNLDAKLRESMRSQIKKIIRENNLTAIYVTHDRNEAMAIADKIAIMRGGKIIQHGNPQDLYNYPNCRFTAEFLGEVNFIEGTVNESNQDSDKVLVTSDLGELKALNCHDFIYQKGDKILLAIRAENIKIYDKSKVLLNKNILQAKLVDFYFMGDHGEYTFELENGKKFAVSSSPFVELKIDEVYQLQLPRKKLIVVEDK